MELAIHEAGHAVVSERLGHHVTGVWANPLFGGGLVRHRHAGCRYEDCVVIILAGDLAVRARFSRYRRRHGLAGDRAGVKWLLGQLRYGTRELNLRHLEKCSRQLVKDNMDAIELVATQLFKHIKLTGKQVRAAIKKAAAQT